MQQSLPLNDVKRLIFLAKPQFPVTPTKNHHNAPSMTAGRQSTVDSTSHQELLSKRMHYNMTGKGLGE